MARHETSGNSGIRTQQVCNGIAKVTNFIPRVAQSLDTLGSVASFRSWCKRNRLGIGYSTRERLWQTQIVPRLNAASSNDSTLHVFEFGVAFGEASRWWLEQLTSTAADYHGFDRFTGLPTDWRGLPAGAFDAGGNTPAIDDSRVTWHVGDLEDTIADIDWPKIEGPKFFNFDLDLFLPSLAAWNHIADVLTRGDILYFDEAFDSDERMLLEWFVLPTGRFEGLGFSPFGVALVVK
jgi:hypothetical protein